MKLRKTLLAIGMALASVAAMAPAAQAEITDNTQSITSTKVLHYEGNFKISSGVGVFVTCPVTAELHVSAAGVPSLRSFMPVTDSCTNGGPFAGCLIENHSFSAGPVDVNTTNPDLTVTNFTIKINYLAPCPVSTTHLIFPEITLRPHSINPEDAHHSMNTLTINGTAGNVEGTTGGAIALDLLHITPSQSNTYTLST